MVLALVANFFKQLLTTAANQRLCFVIVNGDSTSLITYIRNFIVNRYRFIYRRD